MVSIIRRVYQRCGKQCGHSAFEFSDTTRRSEPSVLSVYSVLFGAGKSLLSLRWLGVVWLLICVVTGHMDSVETVDHPPEEVGYSIAQRTEVEVDDEENHQRPPGEVVHRGDHPTRVPTRDRFWEPLRV